MKITMTSNQISVWTLASRQYLDATVGKIVKSLPHPQVIKVLTNDPSTEGIPSGGIILVMGTTLLTTLQAHGIAPKGRTITSLRGKVFEVPPDEGALVPTPGTRYLVTFDPRTIDVMADAYDNIKYDLKLATRLAKTGTVEPEIGDYSYKTSVFNQAISASPERMLEKMGLDGFTRFAIDLETMGLSPFVPGKEIITFQIAGEEGRAYTVLIPALTKSGGDHFLRFLDWLLNNPDFKIIGANLKFDLLWMRVKWGITCTNFTLDTLLVGSLINENRSNSLNTHAKLYTDMGGYDDSFNFKYDKSAMEKVPLDDLLLYSAGDADACLRASAPLMNELLADGMLPDGGHSKTSLANFYVHLLHPVSRAFEDIEFDGIEVDDDVYAHVEADLRDEIESLETALWSLVPQTLRDKYEGKKVSNPSLLADLFFLAPPEDGGYGLVSPSVTEKTGKPSTSITNFEAAVEGLPEDSAPVMFVKTMRALKAADKTLSTYVVGFLKHLQPDGKFHPTYNLFRGQMYTQGGGGDSGTVTGRLSAKNPAIQTLVKHHPWAKRIRKAFVPPDVEWEVFQVDYEQGELKIAACRAGEDTMIAAYNEGRDLHTLTGGALLDYSYDEALHLKEHAPSTFDHLRRGGKAGNFGMIYGISPAGFVVFAKTAYGLDLSLAEAEQFMHRFFTLYPKLKEWHLWEVANARKLGLVRSPLGRVRHLPLINSPDWKMQAYAERQAINSPIQSCLSDMTGLAIKRIRDWLIQTNQQDLLRIAGMTHDSIWGYVKKENRNFMLREVKLIAENLPLEELFGWTPALKFTVDVEAGPTLADLAEVEL